MIAHKEKLKAKTLDEREETIKNLLSGNRRANVKFVLAIGRELDAAHKQLSRNGDGAFNGWCRDKLDLKRTTAWKYLTVYQVFGDCSLCEQSYHVSALYLLAKPSTHPRIRKMARKLAEGGCIINADRVKRLMDADEVEQFELKRSKDDDEDLDPPQSEKKEKAEATFEMLVNVWKRAPRKERRKFKKWVNDRIAKRRGSRTHSKSDRS